MKAPVLILGLLSQAFAASFYDEFRDAMSNVERGFGKLLTDVVTDVKDTIHCTLSAMERVLVLKGVLDKTSAYNYRCREAGMEKKLHLHRNPFDRLRNFNFPSREFSTREISMELETSVVNTNKNINDILKRPLDIDTTYTAKVLQDDSHRLVEISDLLKDELEKLSSNVRKELKNNYFGYKPNSVEWLWSEIKTLHDIQRTSHNDIEIQEIRKVLDKVVSKLELTSNNNNTGSYNIDDIKIKLQRLSSKNHNIQLHDDRAVENVRLHDSQYKSKIVNDVPKSFKEAAHQIMTHNKAGRKISDKKPHAEKSVFDLDSDDFARFSPFSNANSNQKDTVDNAKKIIEDSKHTDQVLNHFFQNHKAGVDVFSNSNSFSFR